MIGQRGATLAQHGDRTGHQQGHTGQLRQRVIQLLAADQREHHEAGQQPAQREAQARFQRAAQARHGDPHPWPATEREQQHRQPQQVEPERLGVVLQVLAFGQLVDHAPGGLGEEQPFAIGVAADQAGRQGPRQQHRAAEQQRQHAGAVPARAVRARPLAPQRPEQPREGNVQQHHRALGQQAQSHAGAEQQPARFAAPRLRCQAQQRRQHPDRQQHVVHDLQGEQERVAERQQHPRRGPGHPRALRKEPPRQQRNQHQLGAAEQHLQHAWPHVADAEHEPAALDQPEQQRRLFAVRLAVDVRHQPVAMAEHVPRHRQCAGGIQRHRTVREDRQQRHQHPQRQPRPDRTQVFGTAEGAGRHGVHSQWERGILACGRARGCSDLFSAGVTPSLDSIGRGRLCLSASLRRTSSTGRPLPSSAHHESAHRQSR